MSKSNSTQKTAPKPLKPNVKTKAKVAKPKGEITNVEALAITIFDKDFDFHANNLSKHYSRFLSLRNDWTQPLGTKKLFLKWLNYYHEMTEEILFKGGFQLKDIARPENIYKAPDERILFQNYNFFKVINSLWAIRFDSNF